MSAIFLLIESCTLIQLLSSLHIERRGETDNLVSGTVEFHTLEKGESFLEHPLYLPYLFANLNSREGLCDDPGSNPFH